MMLNNKIFKTLLPINSTKKERALSETINQWWVDYQTETGLSYDVELIKTLKSAKNCPEYLLPYLAIEFSVDYWDELFTTEQKRALIANSFYVHSIKGTPKSVKQVLKDAGFNAVEIIEGIGDNNYNAKINHDDTSVYGDVLAWAKYRVKISRPISIKQAQQVRKMLGFVAPARCELVGIDYQEAAHLYNNEITYKGQFAHGVA